MSGLLLTCSPAALSQDISSELKVEHRVVSIQENAGLVPSTVIIKRGTTVIWLNYSGEPNVIKFQNKKVTTACRSPINFFLADNGSYQSIPLKIGSVASLCFIEKGTFEYQIRPPNPEWDNPQLLRGTIRVN
jgi:plastocyanin